MTVIYSKSSIFNFLDRMTLADCIKYARNGYTVNIKNGHVQSLVMGGKHGRV